LSILQIRTARAFLPLLAPARFKGAHGGRGSGKSHFFAELAVEWCVRKPGARIVCVREIQKSLKDSVKRLIEDKIAALGVGGQFDIQKEQINTPGGGVIVFQGMQDHTAESIKSLEGFDVAYVEEAQTLTARSLEMLRPTIRAKGSELWFSWNPRTDEDPVDAFLRGPSPPPMAIVVQANFDTNPFFPDELEVERLLDLKNNSDRYAHIWEGAYEPAAIGAYFAKEMIAAQSEGRICSVPYDPRLMVNTWWDLGVDDLTAIWFVQHAGREIRVIDYIEGTGGDAAYWAKELDKKPYHYGECVLPHDAGSRSPVSIKTYSNVLTDHGFKRQTIIPRTDDLLGSINQARLIIPRAYFDEKKCARGIKALQQYRREFDDKRKTYKDHPLHDWASHAADAWRQGAQYSTAPTLPRKAKHHEGGAGAWMG
jgi:phage terminase large subunit